MDLSKARSHLCQCLWMWVVIFQSWGCWSGRSWHVLVGNLHGSWGADISFRHFLPLIIIAQATDGQWWSTQVYSVHRNVLIALNRNSFKAVRCGLLLFFFDALFAYVTPTSSHCMKMLRSSREEASLRCEGLSIFPVAGERWTSWPFLNQRTSLLASCHPSLRDK